jgi:predicted secreted Zn-dependent protease
MWRSRRGGATAWTLDKDEYTKSPPCVEQFGSRSVSSVTESFNQTVTYNVRLGKSGVATHDMFSFD